MYSAMNQPVNPEPILNQIEVDTQLPERFWLQRSFLFKLLFVIIIGVLVFYLGRISVQEELNVQITPTLVLPEITPTVAPSPIVTKPQITCFPPPDCSDDIPPNCSRTPPAYDVNGCMNSCGQLQCESLQTPPTPISCNTDSDCPKSASCVPGDSCYLYYCVNHSCILKAAPN